MTCPFSLASLRFSLCYLFSAVLTRMCLHVFSLLFFCVGFARHFRYVGLWFSFMMENSWSLFLQIVFLYAHPSPHFLDFDVAPQVTAALCHFPSGLYCEVSLLLHLQPHWSFLLQLLICCSPHSLYASDLEVLLGSFSHLSLFSSFANDSFYFFKYMKHIFNCCSHILIL